MTPKLFTIKNDGIIINKEIIMTVPQFRKIYTRDKGSVGDSDGRKKNMAFKELAYIYHVADTKSTPNANAFTEKKSHEYALRLTGLPDDYKPDEVVKEAIELYKLEQYNLPRETINNLVKAYGMVNSVVNNLVNTLQEWIDKDKLSIDEAKSALDTIGLLIQQGEVIPKLTQKLNNAIRELEKLEEKETRDIVKGTDEFVPASMDPDKRY